MSILSEQQVQQELSKLHDWALEGRAIRKQFTFTDFPEAVAFVNRLVPHAEAAYLQPVNASCSSFLARARCRIPCTW